MIVNPGKDPKSLIMQGMRDYKGGPPKKGLQKVVEETKNPGAFPLVPSLTPDQVKAIQAESSHVPIPIAEQAVFALRQEPEVDEEGRKAYVVGCGTIKGQPRFLYYFAQEATVTDIDGQTYGAFDELKSIDARKIDVYLQGWSEEES